MENNMEFTVKWIINGEITLKAKNKEIAETKIKNQLKSLVDENNETFTELGAKAIQGSANMKS